MPINLNLFCATSTYLLLSVLVSCYLPLSPAICTCLLSFVPFSWYSSLLSSLSAIICSCLLLPAAAELSASYYLFLSPAIYPCLLLSVTVSCYMFLSPATVACWAACILLFIPVCCYLDLLGRLYPTIYFCLLLPVAAGQPVSYYLFLSPATCSYLTACLLLSIPVSCYQ